MQFTVRHGDRMASNRSVGKRLPCLNWSVLLSLAVGGFGSVFALVMVFGNVQRNCEIGQSRTPCGAEQNSAEGKAGDVFQHVSVFDGFGRIFSPREWCVAGNQHAWDCHGIEPF